MCYTAIICKRIEIEKLTNSRGTNFYEELKLLQVFYVDKEAYVSFHIASDIVCIPIVRRYFTIIERWIKAF